MTAFIYTTVGRIVADDNLTALRKVQMLNRLDSSLWRAYGFYSHTYNEGRQIIAEAKQSLQADA